MPSKNHFLKSSHLVHDSKKDETFVVIAAFNEQKKIRAVLQDLQAHGFLHIIVVDDCSSDKTAQVALDEGAEVITHIINRGQGASLRTGIEYALAQGAQYIITFDADGQHHASDLKTLLEPLYSDVAQVALGSRFLLDSTQKNIPFIRRLFLKGGIFFLFLLYGIRVTDSQNGLRALSRKAALAIEIRQDRMPHAGEILDEIHRKNIPFVEVPVHITYSDYSRTKGENQNSLYASAKIALRLIWEKFTH